MDNKKLIRTALASVLALGVAGGAAAESIDTTANGDVLDDE